MTPISRILSSGRSLPTVNQGPLFESILLLVIQLLSWHIHVTRLALKCFFFFLLQYNKSLTRGMNCVFRGYSEWDYGLVRVRHYFKTQLCDRNSSCWILRYISVTMCDLVHIIEFTLRWFTLIYIHFCPVLQTTRRFFTFLPSTFLHFYFMITFFHHSTAWRDDRK